MSICGTVEAVIDIWTRAFATGIMASQTNGLKVGLAIVLVIADTERTDDPSIVRSAVDQP